MVTGPLERTGGLSPALSCGNISTFRDIRTSHSGLGAVSNPDSRSATTAFLRVNLEMLFFYGLAQKGTASALLSRAAGVVGEGSIGHLDVPTLEHPWIRRFRYLRKHS